MSRVYNFSACLAVLPEEVLKEVADEMMDYRWYRNVCYGNEPTEVLHSRKSSTQQRRICVS